MLIDIYMPRLDVSFKRGHVPETRSPIPPIRIFWERFVKELFKTYQSVGAEVRVLELPLWQMLPEFVEHKSKNADKIFIPHKSTDNWFLSDTNQHKINYYMQMAIPSIFSIDPTGWCASATTYPMDPLSFESSLETNMILKNLRNRIDNNISKFDQPSKKMLPIGLKNYIFFPCQLPHDETIKYHSDVSVEDALSMTLDWGARLNVKVVIKGHPVNPASMGSLKTIAKKWPHIWLDDFSIHDLIEASKTVVMVNSGVGFEAILHNKSVAIFGKADYDTVVSKINKSTYMTDLTNAFVDLNPFELQKYDTFLMKWYTTHYDVDEPYTFKKLVDI